MSPGAYITDDRQTTVVEVPAEECNTAARMVSRVLRASKKHEWGSLNGNSEDLNDPDGSSDNQIGLAENDTEPK